MFELICLHIQFLIGMAKTQKRGLRKSKRELERERNKLKRDV